MTQDEMIDLAKQAGWQYAHGESGFEPLWAFARLVAAKEREECAKVCESIYTNGDGAECWLENAASKIRARGEQA